MKKNAKPRASLLCSNSVSQITCGLYASVEAVYEIAHPELGYEVLVRKFCKPHATKFAIVHPGRVRFIRIPMPEVKS